jgi:hypothetical protein
MALLLNHRESPTSPGPLRLRLEPVWFQDTLLDGSWWPASPDLGVELPALFPALDHVRGPVARLLLGATGWTARPHHILAAGRTVSVGYFAGRSPATMTVLCADGGLFTLRVAPPEPPPAVQDRPANRRGEDTWEGEGGGLGPLRG